eukprot:2032857-Amphidinium_carterae.1
MATLPTQVPAEQGTPLVDPNAGNLTAAGTNTEIQQTPGVQVSEALPLAQEPEASTAVDPSATTINSTAAVPTDDDLHDAADREELAEPDGHPPMNLNTPAPQTADGPSEEGTAVPAAGANTPLVEATEQTAPELPQSTPLCERSQQNTNDPLPDALGGGSATLVSGSGQRWYGDDNDSQLPPEAESQLRMLHAQVQALRRAHFQPAAVPVPAETQTSDPSTRQIPPEPTAAALEGMAEPSGAPDASAQQAEECSESGFQDDEVPRTPPPPVSTAQPHTPEEARTPEEAHTRKGKGGGKRGRQPKGESKGCKTKSSISQ